ncbi:MAG: heavy-metal-associated domain-containing protein [Bacteroidota bacterium]
MKNQLKKSLYIYIFLGASLLNIAFTSGPKPKPIKKSEIAFQVEGTCTMCKDRIEQSLDKKGVYKAIYDVKSKLLTVTFDPRKLEEIQIHNMVAMVGHDTPLVAASEVVYQSLPDCCRYREDGKCEHDDF